VHEAALRRIDGVDVPVEIRTSALTDALDLQRPRAFVCLAPRPAPAIDRGVPGAPPAAGVSLLSGRSG
jgi:hypothetical protein